MLAHQRLCGVVEGAFAYRQGSVVLVRLPQTLFTFVYCVRCFCSLFWVPTSFVGPLLQCCVCVLFVFSLCVLLINSPCLPLCR